MAEHTDVAQSVYKLSTRELNGDVNLKPEVWRVLTQVNGERTVSDLARNLGLEVAQVVHAVEELVHGGLLEPVTAPASAQPAVVTAAFFDFVTREFTRVMGPIASIIVEDELAALEESRAHFPRERIAELVEGISAEIRDDAKRARFQQIMLDAIRKL